VIDKQERRIADLVRQLDAERRLRIHVQREIAALRLVILAERRRRAQDAAGQSSPPMTDSYARKDAG
jgi:hypothetical protein